MMDLRWTHHGDNFTVHTDIESLGCSPKMNMKGYVNYASVKKKENSGRTICTLTIAEKDEALSFASGSAVFPPLSDVKDTYGLGCSDGIGLGLCISHKLPGNANSCRPLAAL